MLCHMSMGSEMGGCLGKGAPSKHCDEVTGGGQLERAVGSRPFMSVRGG